MSGWFRGFGALRMVLLGVVALLVVLGPFSGGPVRFEGLAVLTTLVAPVAYAVVVFVLPLDMTMTAVFMSEDDPQRRARLKRVLITEGAALALLVLSWLPFVLQLLRVR